MQKTKGLAVFMDIRNSTSIPTTNKEVVYRAFYNQFNGFDIEYEEYRSYIGDGIFLFYKAGSLEPKIIELLKEIQVKVQRVEDEYNIEIGIGVGYGKYENTTTQLKTSEGNQTISIPLSSYIDLASKASLFAHKGSDKHFLINVKNNKSEIDYSSQEELKSFVEDNKSKYNISSKTSSSSKNYRFNFD